MFNPSFGFALQPQSTIKASFDLSPLDLMVPLVQQHVTGQHPWS